MNRDQTFLRHSGIECVGDVSWGTHFCQFYETPQDLTDTLVPYFKAGLEQNEFCMWVTSEPLDHKAAEEALRVAVPDLDDYIKKGALEILPYDEWYLVEGVFDQTRVLDGWIHKLETALARGFDGLRFTGNTFWLESALWRDFYDYEATVNSVIGRYRMLGVCTYAIPKCGAAEVIDVVQNHQFSVVKRQGQWSLIAGVAASCALEADRALDLQLQKRTLALEAALQELQNFSYSVSHDLRSPLRAIDGYSKVLLESYAEQLNQEGKRIIDVIRDNTARMGKIIDDILDFARIGRLELAYEDVDMDALVRSVWEELAPAPDTREVRMQISPLPAARVDRLLMRQVFFNLISNALKATRGTTPSQIDVGSSSRGNELIYYVRDNGMGFDPRFTDRLFGLFQRLHNIEAFPGSGVGLAIVKRIVERHGGSVWAEGHPGHGATFFFSLPAGEQHD
jgi:signal transduction histidine kinase